MRNEPLINQIKQLQQELSRLQTQITILYEITNAMQTTLKLDEILYIILTAITSHDGLAFNRAILLLLDSSKDCLVGTMGIGPDSGEDAQRIWQYIETSRMTLRDLVKQYKASKKISDSKLNQFVKNIRIPLSQNTSPIVQAALSKQILHLSAKECQASKDTVLKKLKPFEIVIIPLKAHDKVVGVILADNPYSKKPILSDDIKMLSMFANQAGLAIENSNLYERTLLQAYTDSLTQLWNHGYFQSSLDALIAQEEMHPIGLILMDIDNFKQYNDAYGHWKGDEILRNVAQIIKESCDSSAIPCRYGGEEFAIIMRKTTLTKLIELSENIRKKVMENGLPTLSIGVAILPENAKTKQELIEMADALLYKAKRFGKNQVQYLSEQPKDKE